MTTAVAAAATTRLLELEVELSTKGIVEVDTIYLPDSGAGGVPARSLVVEENVLTLEVEGVGDYSLMYTPTIDGSSARGFTPEDGLLGEGAAPEDLALALGFALSEGLVDQLCEVRSLSACPDNASGVRLQLHHPDRVSVSRRNVIVNSSCGVCGAREILEDNVLGLNPVGATLAISRGRFPDMMAAMQAGQHIFDETGGSHAAAIFDTEGRLLALAEDLGRHNALDKAIGMVLLQRKSVAGCCVTLSSRLSLEMVTKAVRAGLELMLAVSAPTSLAIEVANRFGVTLCGFVRDGRATVYTHPQRIT